jgi:exodeoxyribonuclease-1
MEAAAQLAITATSFQREVLNEWQNYVQELRKRLNL